MPNPMVTPDAGHIVLASYGLVCVRVCVRVRVRVLRSPSLMSTAQMRETCGKHLVFPLLARLPLVFSFVIMSEVVCMLLHFTQ